MSPSPEDLTSRFEACELRQIPASHQFGGDSTLRMMMMMMMMM